MAYRSLRDFLDRLERAGELARVTEPVDLKLDMAALADRAAKQQGPALLFEKPSSGVLPVAMNLFGTRRRAAWALSCEDLDEPASELRALLKMAPPQGLWDKLKMIPKLGRLASLPPKHVSSGPVQEIVDREPDMGSIPVLTTWPHDGGPFITLPQVITRDPETGIRNVGMYRCQVMGPRKVGLHWQLHKTAHAHWRAYRKRGERMPVAIALGGDPALTYCASAPLPPGIDEYLFAGFLRKESVHMVKGVTVDLEVPADADVVIEGYVSEQGVVREGPFGDHTGYYSLADDYPVLHVEAITMRKHPVFPATIVGRPPQEDAYLGLATERIFLPLLRMVLPEICDMHLPAAGAFHNLVILSMKKEYPGHPQKVMSAIWGTGQIMFTKGIVIVDEDIDPHDLTEVLFRLTSNVDPKRDLLFTEGPLDVLDHAADRFAYGSKVGVDATRKNKPWDGYPREWPRDLAFPDDVLERVARRWSDYGL